VAHTLTARVASVLPFRVPPPITVAAFIVTVMPIAPVRAGVIDITQPHSSATLDGGIFQTSDFAGAGTGVLQPFVRMQANGAEQGYNTSGRPLPFDETASANFTHDLRISDVGLVLVGDQLYREFWLDINQSNSQPASLLSLDRLQVYTSPVGGQTTTAVPSLGTLRYDLDAGGDNWIVIDGNLASGSGQGDVQFLLPVSALGSAAASDYLYLYSRFGDHNASNSGFEEWAIQTPAPGPAALGAVALAPVLRRRRR
jgi:hypothetical protein